MLSSLTNAARAHLVVAGSRGFAQVYRPGQVIKLNRVIKKVDRKLEGAEAQAAWQIGWATSLVLVFMGLPWAYNRALDAMELRKSSDNAKQAMQRSVYEQRLENREQIAAGTYVPRSERR